MSTHKATRRNAPTIVAIIAGEPTTIAAGDYLCIAYSGGGGGRPGGFRGPGATHETEAAADRDRGQYVRATTDRYVDRNGNEYGPAVRLDGGLVHEGNVHAVCDAAGNPRHRFARNADRTWQHPRQLSDRERATPGRVSDDGERVHVLDTAGRRTVIGRWLALFTRAGNPTTQLVAVIRD